MTFAVYEQPGKHSLSLRCSHSRHHAFHRPNIGHSTHALPLPLPHFEPSNRAAVRPAAMSARIMLRLYRSTCSHTHNL